MKNSTGLLRYHALVGACFVVGAALIAGPIAAARADGAKPANVVVGSAAGPATSADLHRLVAQLDSDVFAARDYSARRLFETGRPAIGPLADAAHGRSLEQTTAAIEILHRFLQSGDSDTKNSAKAVLEKIAQGDSDSAASLAADALRPPAEAVPPVMYVPTMGMIRNVNVMRMQQRAARLAAARARAAVIIKAVPAQPANPPANPAPRPAK